MFKKTLTILAISLSLQPGAEAAPATGLLPEVAAIVQNLQEPDETVLMQDVYVGLLAMTAPEGMDYMAIGSQVVLSNFDYLKQTLIDRSMDTNDMSADAPKNHFNGQAELELETDGKKFEFPCSSKSGNFNCIADTLAQKEEINRLIERNSTLMQRYLHIRKMPHWGAHLYTPMDPFPSYHPVIVLSYIRMAQAIIAFDAGKTDEGFALLEQETAFARRMLREDDTLIGKMVAIRLLHTNYHTVSALLDTPALQEYLGDKRLTLLLAPFTKQEQQSMAKSFEFERNFALYAAYAINVEKTLSDPSSDEGDEALSFAEKKALAAQYDPVATGNLLYLMYEPAIKRAALTLQEVADLYAHDALEPLEELSLRTLQEQPALLQYASGNSIFGESIVEAILPLLDKYLERIYDVQVYLALVNAKLLLLASGLDVQDDVMITAFLQQQGEATRNPYSRQTFEWHADERVLATEWLNIAGQRIMGIRAHTPAAMRKPMAVRIQ